jgi:hypothetical protein
MGENFVRNGSVFQANIDHLVARHFATFSYGIGDFASFSKTYSDPTASISNDDQGAEIKTATALNHFRGAIDENNLLGQFLSSSLLVGVHSFRPRFAASPADSPSGP